VATPFRQPVAQYQSIIAQSEQILENSVVHAELLTPPSVHPNAAGSPIELRVSVGFVVGRIEEGAAFLRTRRDDGDAGHDPDADDVAPASVDVASVLERLLRIGRVHAAGMLVRRAVLGLGEDFPQLQLVISDSTVGLTRVSHVGLDRHAADAALRRRCFSA